MGPELCSLFSRGVYGHIRCVHVLYKYRCVYIYRDVYIYIDVCIYIYIYSYIYIERERGDVDVAL